MCECYFRYFNQWVWICVWIFAFLFTAFPVWIATKFYKKKYKEERLPGLVVIALLVIFFSIPYAFSELQDSVFSAFQTFTAFDLDSKISNNDQYTGNPYIKEKIVSISQGGFSYNYDSNETMGSSEAESKPEIDVLFCFLNKEIRADSTKDVGTIVLLTWEEDTIAYYTHSRDIRIKCNVKIYTINSETAVLVGDINFWGDLPEKRRPGQGHRNVFGTSPVKEIIKYINELPRR